MWTFVQIKFFLLVLAVFLVGPALICVAVSTIILLFCGRSIGSVSVRPKILPLARRPDLGMFEGWTPVDYLNPPHSNKG